MVDYARYYAPTTTLFWTGAASLYWTNAANWVSNLLPATNSDLSFSYLSGSANGTTLGEDYAIHGLYILETSSTLSLNGNTLTLGAGGIDAISQSVTLNSAVAVGAVQTWTVGPGHNVFMNGNLSGSNSLTKAGAGTLRLTASNSFTGTLYVDSNTAANLSDGNTMVTHPSALASVASPIYLRNNNSGSSTLQLNGTAGSIILTQALQISCRNNTVQALQNVAGNNAINGDLLIVQGGSNVVFQSDSGTLTLYGALRYVGSLVGTRTWNFQGNGNTLIAGPILNSTNGSVISLGKAGSGTLTLSNANTFTGVTRLSAGTLQVNGSLGTTAVTVTGGTLSGNGAILGPVSVQPGATLAPGGSIGSLTISNTLSLAGTTLIELNAALGTNDSVQGLTQVTYGGTLLLTNLGGTMAAGQTFKLFSAASDAGSFTSVLPASPGPGLYWNTNNLPLDGTLSVLALPPPTIAGLTLSGPNLNLSATGGLAGSSVLLLSSTNFSAPLATWLRLATNAFDTTGSVQFTIALDAALSQQFFSLQVR
jgi:autotransporter-associated beta strand protein